MTIDTADGIQVLPIGFILAHGRVKRPVCILRPLRTQATNQACIAVGFERVYNVMWAHCLYAVY